MGNLLKRGAAFCLAAVMCIGCTTACSDKNEDGSSKDGSSSTQVTESIGNLDLSDVKNESNVPKDFSEKFEAEDGKLSGSSVVKNTDALGKFSGKGFVMANTTGDEISFTVDFPADGSYDFTFRACAANATPAPIKCDDETVSSFSSSKQTFEEISAEKVMIKKGKHKISICSGGVAIFVDNFTITAAEEVDLSQYKVSNKLSNPNASENTKRLYNFLCDVYGKYIISGQSSGDNLGKESREFIKVSEYTGKTPAMLSLDMINLSNSAISKGAGGGEAVIDQAIDWYNNENGIVSFVWHWYAPEKYLGTNGQPWYRGFYSDSTSFNLAKAMNGEDKEGYDAIVADLDHMAEMIGQLKDAGVPILWRPLHEAAGDPNYPGKAWFWWGSGGKDAYLKLWKLMYDKFTNEYKLDNIIWVWNGQSPDWYPGDEYVDILSYDCYPEKRDISSQKKYFDLMQSCTKTNKIIAMSENGSLFDPDYAFNDGARWAWFSTWNGEFTLKDMILSDEYTSFDEWKKIYNSERVLTLDELPNLKTYPLDTEKFLAEQKNK